MFKICLIHNIAGGIVVDKQQFNKMDVLKQLEYINAELEKGGSLRGISGQIGLSKTTIRDRFEKTGYKFNAEQKQYVKVDNMGVLQFKHDDMLESKHSLNIIKDTDNSTPKLESTDTTQIKHAHNIKTAFNKDDVKALQDLISIKDDLMQLLISSKDSRTIIDVPEITIDSLRLSGNIKTRSFNIYESVIDEFIKFCENNKAFTQKDLLSMAIVEYIDRYKR